VLNLQIKRIFEVWKRPEGVERYLDGNSQNSFLLLCKATFRIGGTQGDVFLKAGYISLNGPWNL